MPHVVVVGGGMAGAAAALAARRAGAEVTLIRRAPGATALSSGALDAVPPAAADDAAGWLERLPRADPDHPYVAGGQAPDPVEVTATLQPLVDGLAAAGLALRLALTDPVRVAAVTGEVRSAGLVARVVASGDLHRHGSVAVAGPVGLVAFDAGAVARSIAERATGIRAVAVSLPVPGLENAVDVDAGELARTLERAGVADEIGRRLRDLVEGTGAEVVLLPPVLGIDTAEAVALRVYAAAGVPVAELLAAPPSPPGLRLERALRRLLDLEGVRVLTGAVRTLAVDGGRVTAATVAVGAGRPVESDPVWPDRLETVPCDALVLAGGRFIGGGLTREGRPREPLLDLPVHAAGLPVERQSASDLVDRPRFRSQPILAAGLRTDGGGRPLGRDGRPAYANVTAAGALLAGLDTTLDRGGLGVVAWTGLRAGSAAARAAGSASSAEGAPA